MKKILAIILSVVLAFGMSPLGTIASTTETIGYYAVLNDEATITNVSTSISGNATIPSTLGGYPVTSIGGGALDNVINLEKVYSADEDDTSSSGDNDLTEDTLLAGDANCDGVVDDSDIAAITNILLKKDTEYTEILDINADGKIDVIDGIMLRKQIGQNSTCLHSYMAATCTRPKECEICGALSGKALGHNYVLGECTNCNDYSDSYCPKLYFTGDMSQITDPAQTNKNIECEIAFEYRSGDRIESGAAKIKIQGTSSVQYPKKNYTIKLYKDADYSSKQKIDVGWGPESKYCLKANWIDKTHARNIVSANIAANVQAKYDLFTQSPHNGTIDGFPVEIYINGEFHGLYTMNIPKDDWMFGMDDENPNHIVICGENWNSPVLFKSVPTDFNDWSVEVGSENDATLSKIQRLVSFVKDSTDDEFKANFSQYLDLDSTLNYYVMMNYFWASDNTGKNMLLATYDGKVWYPTMYDLDTTWGTYWDGSRTYDYSTGYITGGSSLLWQKLEKNFKKEIADRYFELRNSILDPDSVMEEFNNFYNQIPQEVLDRERAKWNTAEQPIPGFGFGQIQDYLNTVVPRLDARFEAWK